MTALRRAVAETRARRGLLALSVLLGAGAILASVGLLTTSGYLISRAAQRPEILALGVAIVGVRFFGISRALLRYAERLVSHDLAFRTLTDLRARFFARLVPLVPVGVADLRRGDLLARFVGDVDRLQDLYLRAVGPPPVALVAGAVSVLVATLILPVAGLALAGLLLLAGVAAPALTRWSARSAGRRQSAARAALGNDLVEIASGSAEIAVAGREEEWIARCDRDSARLTRLQRRDALSGGLAVGLGTALAAGGAVLLTAVAIPSVQGGALAGVMLAALALLAMGAFEAVAPLGGAAASVDACAAAARRIEEVLDREPAVAEPSSPRPLGAIGGLEFRDVRFRFDEDGPWVLDGVDLRLSPGRSVALLGPSGVGKSTLAELAVRFRDPVAGTIAVGGVDIRDADSEEVRRAVRLAPQDAYLFTTTLRDNVAVGRADAGDPEIVSALEAVGLGRWLASLPEGLATEVGEEGALVSGGQRQRIAAARLLLADARFLIFDEPTAHLDPTGAAALQRRLASLAHEGGPGVLVITHELHEPAVFDEVLCLERGRIRALQPA
ncbi:MAG TPA: thiol reductant ABC exporter subunit CydC [Solirubrobacterales bacterium]|nr:thiol reductant ABC exporter subunit CydC [Solirubrobacterales bacterium]